MFFSLGGVSLEFKDRIVIREVPELIELLLKDRTTRKNIIWATDSYTKLGDQYNPTDQIKPHLVTNGAGHLIKPRSEKAIDEQKERTKIKAEVYTPTWVVKKQNDLVEDEIKDLSLKEYINKTWLEITCGEAPYMCSRYDMVTGESIPIYERVGFVDRKLQRISKEIDNHDDWLEYAYKAYKSSYGYEFQGDSLLLARENLVYTFIEYYYEKFNNQPDFKYIKEITGIVSYNAFQMDGLTYTIPMSQALEMNEPEIQLDLFGNFETDGVQLEMEFNKGIKVKIDRYINNQMLQFEKLAVYEGSNKMKFDVVIGNPPYQENVSSHSGNRSLAKQLFPSFIMSSTKISKKYVSLITPAKWFTSQGQDHSFPPLRKYVKDHNYFKQIHYFGNDTNLFDDVEIGAVNYYLYDKSYKGDTLFVNYFGENRTKKSEMLRPLFEENLDIILSLNPMVTILEKVRKYPNVESLTEITKGRNAFNITGKEAKKVSQKNYFKGAYELRASYEEIRFISPEKIEKNIEIAENWKIFISKANGGAGTLSDGKQVSIIGEPYIGKPGSVCTDSLIPIGSFETEIEAINLRKYLKTKFVRFMVGIMKTSQNITQIVYRFVPLQDFSLKSDIEWNETLLNIDNQLYKKYGLEKEQVDFIENIIKEME